MPGNSSTSSFRLPRALIAAVLLAAAAELTLGFFADRITDKSALCIRYKLRHMAGAAEDAVIFGTSRTLAVDARALERPGLRVFNASLPNFETTRQFPMTLERYLLLCRKAPALVLLSVPQEMLGGYLSYDDFSHLRFELFRRFFTPWFVFRHMESADRGELLPMYDWRCYFPSFDLRRVLAVHWKNAGLSTEKLSVFMERNRQLLATLERTKGQMLFDEGTKLEPKKALTGLPATEKEFRETLRWPEPVEEFVRTAGREGIRVVMFDTPLPEPRYERMQRLGYFDAIRRMMREMENRHPHFVYRPAADPYYSCDLFADRAHLNTAGSRRYNAEFKHDFDQILQDCGITEKTNTPAAKSPL